MLFTGATPTPSWSAIVSNSSSAVYSTGQLYASSTTTTNYAYVWVTLTSAFAQYASRSQIQLDCASANPSFTAGQVTIDLGTIAKPGLTK